MAFFNDPTKNNTEYRLFTEKKKKPVYEYKTTLEYSVFDREKTVPQKIISDIQLLKYLQSNKNDRYFAYIYYHYQTLNHLMANQ